MTARPEPDRQALTLVELLVALGVVAVLAGLVLAGVQRVRAAAGRAACQNNIRQLALALHHHHDAHRVLPCGHRSVLNRDLMPFSGWTLSVLPHFDRQPVHDAARVAYRASLNPFNNPPHTGLDTVIPGFLCPADGRISTPQVAQVSRKRVAFTSYLGVSGKDHAARDGVLFQDSRLNLAAVTDGTSHTLMLGERPPGHDFQLGWWYAGVGQRLTGSADMILGVREANIRPVTTGSACGPGNYPFGPSAFGDPCGVFHFWSPHEGGANFALADGSVRFVGYPAADLLPALASRAGGERAAVPD